MTIVLAETPADFAAAGSLVRRYVEWLDIDLSFQDFEDEIADLATRYRPPAGAMFLARSSDGRYVGCCGFTPLGSEMNCELKRFFVAPEARGSGLGRKLLSAAVGHAKAAGYTDMYLDTLPRMTGALKLYAAFNFERTLPYYDNPIAEAAFFHKVLTSD